MGAIVDSSFSIVWIAVLLVTVLGVLVVLRDVEDVHVEFHQLTGDLPENSPDPWVRDPLPPIGSNELGTCQN